MSNLLKSWLSQDLGLSFVSSFESDFSNGYRLGEIMHKVGLQPDFHSFINAEDQKAMVTNFNKLLPSMMHLGVEFDSKTVNELMIKRQGVATQLLYAIKMALARVGKAGLKLPDSPLHDSKKFSANFSPKSRESVKSPIVSSLLLSPSAERKVKSPSATMAIHIDNPGKHSYISMQERLFESRLLENSREVAGRDARNGKAHLARFEEEMMRMERSALEKKLTEEAIFSDRRVQLETQRRRERRQHVEEKTKSDYLEWAEVQKFRSLREQKDLSFELTQKENSRARALLARTEATLEVNNCIDDFERNAVKLGIPLEDESAVQGPELLPDEVNHLSRTANMDSMDHLKYLSTMIPDRNATAKLANDHLNKIQQKISSDKAARKERERRRRKVLVDQVKAGQEAEEKRKEITLLERFSRQSVVEKELSENLWRTRQMKLIIKENRILKDAELKKKFDESLKIERSGHEWIRAQAEAEQRIELNRVRFKESESNMRKEILAATTSYARTVLNKIIDLSFQVVNYRSLGEEKVPAKIWREWVSKIVDENISGNDSKNDKLFNHLQDNEVENLADEAFSKQDSSHAVQIDDYINSFGAWSDDQNFGNANIPTISGSLKLDPSSYFVGVILNSIENAAAPPLPPLPPQIPKFPIGISLLGKPKSGKLTLAKQLASKYDLEIVILNNLIESAISSNLTEDHPFTKIKKGLSDNTEISDELYVELYVIKLKELHEKKQGYILIDFPKNSYQAALLEAVLSGFDISKIKATKDAKLKDSKDERKKKLAALPSAPPRTDPLPSGLDLVIYLEALESEHDVLVKRCLWKRIDPITGIEYELDKLPEREICDRLKIPDDLLTLESALPVLFLKFDAEFSELKEWFSQFNILVPISALLSVDSVSALALKNLHLRLEKNSDVSVSNDSKPKYIHPIAITDSNLSSLFNELISYVAKPLDKNISTVLYQRFNTLEKDYFDSLRTGFSQWNLNHQSMIKYTRVLLKDFSLFVQRPAKEKQEAVENFQANFNLVDADLRFDDETKAELHQRVEELSDTLWSIVVRRKELAAAELIRLKDAKFADWQCEWYLSLYLYWMNMEWNRHCALLELIKQFLFAQGKSTMEITEEFLAIPGVLPVTFPSLPTDFKNTEKYSTWSSQMEKFADKIDRTGDKILDPKKDKPAAKKDKEPMKVADPDIKLMLATKLQETVTFLSTSASSFAIISESNLLPQKANNAPPGKESKSDKEAREAKERAENVALEQENQNLNEWNSAAISIYNQIRSVLISLFEYRIGRLDKMCQLEWLSIRGRLESIWTNLDNLIGEQVKQENNAIETLTKVIRISIEKEENLTYSLTLDDTMRINSDLRLLESEKFRDEEFYSAWFQPFQILNLVQHYSGLCVVPEAEFMSFFQRLGVSDPTSLPEDWKKLNINNLRQIATEFSYPPVELESNSNLLGNVDWRKFIISLLIPMLPPLKIRDIKNIRNLFLQHDKNRTGNLAITAFQDIKLWFEASVSESDTIKNILVSLFSTKDTLSWRILLSYFALDDEFHSGAEKLFSIYSEDDASSVYFNTLPFLLFCLPVTEKFPAVWVEKYWNKYSGRFQSGNNETDNLIAYDEFVKLYSNDIRDLTIYFKRKNIKSILQNN